MTCGVGGGEEGKAVELDTLRKCGSGKRAFLHNALQSGHDSRHAKYLGSTLKHTLGWSLFTGLESCSYSLTLSGLRDSTTAWSPSQTVHRWPLVNRQFSLWGGCCALWDNKQVGYEWQLYFQYSISGYMADHSLCKLKPSPLVPAVMADHSSTI